MFYRITSAIILFLCAVSLSAQDQNELPLLLQQADELSEEGEMQKAIEKYQQVLSILKTQDDQKSLADVTSKLGVAYRELGKYDDALKALNEALEIHDKIGDQLGSGSDLNALAYMDSLTGKYDEGISLGEKALAVHQNIHNKNGIMGSLNAIARCYWRKNEYEKAIEYVNHSLDIATEINDKFGTAQNLNLLGAINWEQGNYARALEFYKKALPIAEQFKNKSRLGSILGNIGLVYWNQGDLDQAFEYLNQGLEIDRGTGNLHKVGIDLYNIGAVEGERDNYEKKKEKLLEAIELAKQINDKNLLAVCLHSLGSYNLSIGNYDSAEQYYVKAAQIAEELGDKRTLAYSLSSMGELHLRNGDYAGYLNYNEKALKIFEEIGEKRGICAALNSIGEAHLKLGNLDQSLIFFQKALSIGESIGSKYEQCDSYLGIGSVYYVKRKMNDAAVALSRSVELSQQMKSRILLWQAMYKRGLVSRDSGKNEEALQFWEQAIETVEKGRNEIKVTEERTTYLVRKLDIYDDLIHLLIATQKMPDAFHYVQRAKARSFLDTLTEARIDPEGRIDSATQLEKKKIVAELVKTETQIRDEYETEKIDEAKVKELKTKRNELDTEYNDLLSKIRKQNPRFANLQYPQPLRLTEAQAIIDEQSVLLEYFLGKNSSFLFAITRTDFHVFKIPSEQKLAAQVNLIHDVLQKPDPHLELSEKAHTTYAGVSSLLYEELIAPAQNELTGKHRIIIAPDGILNYLPFECLLTRRTKSGTIDFSKLPYLTRDYEIQYIPSVSVLKALGAHRYEEYKEQDDLIAFADPVYAAERSWNKSVVTALPNSRIEVERIARLFPKNKINLFFGKDASETNIKRNDLTSYRRFHFAGHSVIDEERPQFSALLLSDEARDKEDGNLTMLEIFDLKLKADLVVLSSCNSALGKEIRGEGMTGLSRAFLSIGAASVLVTLWDVNDRSTADLVSDFYSYMASGSSKVTALREARLKMIRTGKYSHPYYWAAFALIGEL